MRTRTALCGAVVGVVALAGGAGAFGPVTAPPGSGLGAQQDGHWKFRADLGRTVREAAADDLIPISVVMRHQADPARIEAAQRIANKAARRAAVIDELKAAAAAGNAGVMEMLTAERERGNVGARLRPLWIRNVVATSATPAVVRALAARDDVAYINWDKQLTTEMFPVEPGPDVFEDVAMSQGNIECGVDLMGAPEVWNDLDITGRDVVVGIIDTGACVAHPDLANQIWVNPGEIAGNNIDDDNNGYIDDVNGYNFRDDSGPVPDTNGHGTHTGGTVVGDGAGGTATGMAPDAKLQVLKFWNSFSGESVVWEATQYAVDNDADVITASIGWPHSQNPDRVTWRESNENAMAAGVVVVYAAGNEGGCCAPDNVRTPGDVPDMITCGATDCNDNIAGFSSRGPITWQGIEPWDDWPYPPGKLKPTVSAPGVSTQSCRHSPCNGYRALSGTSMATPHIAGAIALVLEANPGLDHWDVKQLLKDTALDLGANGPDNVYGHGRVNAFAAVEEALAGGLLGDLDDDGDVDFQDLLLLLGEWGDCDACDADLDEDGDVDFQDLLLLIAAWTG